MTEGATTHDPLALRTCTTKISRGDTFMHPNSVRTCNGPSCGTVSRKHTHTVSYG